MRFVHGSKQKITKFKLFDYSKSNSTNELDNNFIDNGNDSEGPGIYALSVDDPNNLQKAIDAASRYAGEDGYLYFFSMDVEKEDLLNNITTDRLDMGKWSTVVNEMIDSIRGEGWESRMENLIYEVSSQLEEGVPPSPEEICELFSDYNISEDDCDYDGLESYVFEEQLREACLINDPASHLIEEGGPRGIIDYAEKCSDNAWDFLKSVWSSTAIHGTGINMTSLNNSFYRSVSKSFKDHTPPGAYIEDCDFYVLFDVDETQIEKVVSLSPKEVSLEY